MMAAVVAVSQKGAFCYFRYITLLVIPLQRALMPSSCLCVCVCVHIYVSIIIHAGKDILSLTENNGILVVTVLLWWIFNCTVNLVS